MSLLDAIILGIVEGLTEFLPVSSTGHLILTNALLGLSGEAVNAYAIVIQLGAILAVVALYRGHVWAMLQGMAGRNPRGLALAINLVVAFLPAAFAGLLLGKHIKRHLFYPYPVAAALILGGVAMIVVEQLVTRRRAETDKNLRELDEMTLADALAIGCAQCLALWPGTSRSMVTIVSSQLRGFSSRAAAEISFLLALPTLGSATLYDLYKEREALAAMENGVVLVLVGNAVAFVVAAFAVRSFVGIVNRSGMKWFGVYRIVAGILFICLAAAGWLTFAPK